MPFHVSTQDLAKFKIPERDQTHGLFNNTWGNNEQPMPHESMVAGLSLPERFEAMAAWDWPHWDKPYTHGWHSIYHGLDAAAGINTDTRFPFEISKYGSLTLDIPNVYVVGDGKWGLGFDCFLYKQQPFTKENVQAEIFIAAKRQGYPTPAELATVSSCGVSYGYGKWAPNSNLYSFWRKDNPAVPFRLTIDIYDFIRFLLARGFVQNANLLTGIFFGCEPIEGSGLWRIDSYYTNLATTPLPPPGLPCHCFTVTSYSPFTQIPSSIKVDGVPVQTSKSTSLAVGSTHTFEAVPYSSLLPRSFDRYYWNKTTTVWQGIDSVTGTKFTWIMPKPPASAPDGWVICCKYS